MLQPNKLMTWKEMVKEYPGKWVFVEQTKGDEGTLEEGYVKFVCTDDEMEDVWIMCMDNNWNYVKERTTIEPLLGIITGVNFKIESEVIYETKEN